MRVEYFIAKRFIASDKNKKEFASPLIRLTVFAIALSVTVMIVSISVVTGFKNEIRKRVVGFGSHIQILNFDSNNSFETTPIPSDLDFLPLLNEIPGINHVQKFATKPGLIRTDSVIQGVVVKGIGSDFNWSFFKQNLKEGQIFEINNSVRTNQVLISTELSRLLNLKVDDEFAMFFIDEKPRVRRFQISGLFETSLEEFDKQFILADIKHIQRLNNWNSNQVSGIEILIDDYKNINLLTEHVRGITSTQFLEDNSRLRVVNIRHKYPQIFDWLNLLDMNVWVILLIMTIVSVINMISGLIIIILDRTTFIGLLKALGAANNQLKNIFLIQAGYLILKGLVMGNIFAFILIFIQKHFHLIKLNQTSYFIDFVPINFSPGLILLLNISAMIIVFITMLFPVIIVSRVNPVKTLRYE